MAKKHYDEDFKKQIVKIYNQGNHTYRGLADEYGISATSDEVEIIMAQGKLKSS